MRRSTHATAASIRQVSGTSHGAACLQGGSWPEGCSILDSTSCVATETAGLNLVGQAKDYAGNLGTDAVTVKLDKLSVERTKLRAEKQALASQLSLAAASSRIQLLARRQGLVPADPTQTTYVRLGRREH